MSAVMAAVVVAALSLRAGRDAAVATLGVWSGLTHPMPAGAALITVVAVRRWRDARAITRQRQAADRDVMLLVELVGLALVAGRTVRGALEAAASHVHPGLRVEVDDLLGAMDREGAAAALAAVPGRLAGLARVVAGAVASGAPVALAVGAHADRLRHAQHQDEVAAARRLPVRMLLPLTLLILPGFVVLAVGPAVIQALARLGPIP